MRERVLKLVMILAIMAYLAYLAVEIIILFAAQVRFAFLGSGARQRG